ncbi:Ima1 N-terminal domain containing protein, partial [Amanita muscaria]
MSTLFQRHSNLRCFFCHSTGLLNQDPRNFKCQACGCWNRYDRNGEIISDEPAMHDEALNSISFAKRASPSKDRLPTAYGKGPFCHTCQTNQMLLVNLLSSYLPSPDNADYRRRLDKLPEYTESLHARYPPVCDSCLPAVEEEIRNKDHMARTKALGGWLKESKGKDTRRRVSGTSKDRDHLTMEILAWRVRGVLWAISLIAANLGYAAALLQYPAPKIVSLLQPILPVFVIVSLLWTVWNPTYAAYRKAQIQGRDVRVKGKRGYNLLQMTTWCLRLTTSIILSIEYHRPSSDILTSSSKRTRQYFSSCLILETIVFVASFFTLRLQHPPPIRLINSKSHVSAISRSSTPIDGLHSRATTPGAPLLSNGMLEPDLTTLSLSSKPIINPPKPVFGHPSLPSGPSVPSAQQVEEGADEMDWAPTDPVAYAASQKGKQKSQVTTDDGSWMRPQRFFAPEQPTGLESLFEKTRLTDDTPSSASDYWSLVRNKVLSHLQLWWRMYLVLCIPLFLGVGYRWW